MQKALALISSESPKKLDEILLGAGFEIMRLPPSPCLQRPVRSHTDMLVFHICDTVFCHESYLNDNKEIFSRISEYGYKTEAVKGEYREDYPQDVRFNLARIGKKLFLGSKTDADEICEYAKQNGFEIIRVKQGYTKCSTCIVSDNAIITADVTIEKAAKACGIDVLRIQEGHVDLLGYSHGFIGGASGAYGDTVYFVGDVSRHPNGSAILEFCEKHKKKVSFIKEKKLLDVGSILFLSSIDF